MKSQFKMKAQIFRSFSLLLCFILMAGSLVGCQPLRKKFTRAKKKDAQSREFIPVLEPVDYARAQHSPEEYYKSHYFLWKVWYRDLLDAVSENKNEKRLEYTYNQMVLQLKEMNKFIRPDKQPGLNEILEDLRSLEADLRLSPAMRDTTRMRLKIERNAKKIVREFTPETAKAFLVSALP